MFYVFVRDGRAPRVTHPTEASAVTEARRLHDLLQKPAYAVRLIEAIGETAPIPLTRHAVGPKAQVCDDGVIRLRKEAQ